MLRSLMAEIETNEMGWIASRTYRAKRRGEPDAPWRDIFVAISAPRKLSNTERTIETGEADYGCTVQCGAERTKRIVPGRDALAALFRGILVIDGYLMMVSKKEDLQDENGEDFDASIHGFLLGPTARSFYDFNKSGDMNK
jgi:hypothetical protein